MKPVFNTSFKLARKTVWALGVLTLLLFGSIRFLHAAPIDFFDVIYEPTAFSKTDIAGPEIFYATIKAKATLSQDLPKPIVALRATLRYYAENNETGEEVVLNPNYVGAWIEPFPSKVGDSFVLSEKVPLQFPAGSLKGEYTVYEQAIKADISKPEKPAAPTKPTAPTKPSAPSGPDGSAHGDKPSKPPEPNQPPEPEQPSEPGHPPEPGEPQGPPDMNQPSEPRELGTIMFQPGTTTTSLSISSLTLMPDTMTGGDSLVGTVTLSGSAPTGGQRVRLSASPAISAKLPMNIRIKAGETSGDFKILTKKVTVPKEVTVSAWLPPATGPSKVSALPLKVKALLTINPASSSTWACGDSMTDARDGKSYSTVQIGAQCWMSQNLNIGTKITSCDKGFAGTCANTTPKQTTNEQGTSCSSIQKFCYGDSEDNCTAYGGLYQGNQAVCGSSVDGTQGICPADWHVPTDKEWFALEKGLTDEGQTCGSSRDYSWDCASAGAKLRSGGSSGFNALLLGTRSTTGGYFNRFSEYKDGKSTLRDKRTGFWTSTGTDFSRTNRFLDSNDTTIMRYAENTHEGYFVRCLKNDQDIPPMPFSISEFTVLPTSLEGGGLADAMLTLSDSAPAGGLTINLSADLKDAVSLPDTIKVAEGETLVRFSIQTQTVQTVTNLAIKATLNSSFGVAKLTLNPITKPRTIFSVTVSPDTLIGGGKAVGTVNLSGPAPEGGLTVLLSADPSNMVTIPMSEPVAAGANSATFDILTKPVIASSEIKFTTMLGSSSKTAILKITTPAPLALSDFTLSETSVTPVTNGAIQSVGTVILNGPAPAGGQPVRLSISSNEAKPASNLTIAEGKTSGTFNILTNKVSVATKVTFTAVVNNSQKTAALTLNPITVSDFKVSPTEVTSGKSSTGTVTVSLAVPNAPQTIYFSADPGSAVNIPGSLTLNPGITSGTFNIQTNLVTVPTQVTLTATLGGSRKTAVLTVNPLIAALPSLILSPTSILDGNVVMATVTLKDPAPFRGLDVELTHNLCKDFVSFAAVETQPPLPPKTYVHINQNETIGTFSMTTKFIGIPEGSSRQCDVIANVNGQTLSKTFTVTHR